MTTFEIVNKPIVLSELIFPEGIKTVKLLGCGITSLAGLNLPNSVTQLYLSDNLLTNIDENELSNSITGLTINNNKLKNCNFLKNKNISYLSLENNEISDISGINGKQLSILNLNNNNIVGDIVLNCNVTILDLKGNKITGLIFNSDDYVESIKLGHNNISDLNKLNLPKYYGSLELEDNFIENIPENYQFSESISGLYLDKNLIKTLKNNKFVIGNNMKRLRYLDLSNNLISDLDSVIFTDKGHSNELALRDIDLRDNYIVNFDVPAINTIYYKTIKVTDYGDIIVPSLTRTNFEITRKIKKKNNISLKKLINDAQGVHKVETKDVINKKMNIIIAATNNIRDPKNLDYFINKYPDILSYKEYIDTFISHYENAFCNGKLINNFLIDAMNFIESSDLEDKNNAIVLIANGLEYTCKAYDTGKTGMSCGEGACENIIHTLTQIGLFPSDEITFQELKDSVLNFLGSATSVEPRIPEELIKIHLLIKMRDKYENDFHKYKKEIVDLIEESVIYYGGRKTTRGGRKSAKKQSRKKSIKKISRKKSAKKQSRKKQSRKKSTKKISRKK
jgi:Leucine-rich repeat (LRR) protein